MAVQSKEKIFNYHVISMVEDDVILMCETQLFVEFCSLSKKQVARLLVKCGIWSKKQAPKIVLVLSITSGCVLAYIFRPKLNDLSLSLYNSYHPTVNVATSRPLATIISNPYMNLTPWMIPRHFKTLSDGPLKEWSNTLTKIEILGDISCDSPDKKLLKQTGRSVRDNHLLFTQSFNLYLEYASLSPESQLRESKEVTSRIQDEGRQAISASYNCYSSMKPFMDDLKGVVDRKFPTSDFHMSTREINKLRSRGVVSAEEKEVLLSSMTGLNTVFENLYASDAGFCAQRSAIRLIPYNPNVNDWYDKYVS